MLNRFSQIDAILKETLKPGRYMHTLGVAYTAASLAMRYQTDIEQAFLAGLLHDCAKCVPDKEALNICLQNQISISDFEARHLYLLHAKLGAFYARQNYGITDEAVLSAIRWHTTGTENMTALEQILFLADYIEPGRKEFDGLQTARRAAFENLNQATALVLKQTIQYLQPTLGDDIDSNTKTAYAYYKQFIPKEDKTC